MTSGLLVSERNAAFGQVVGTHVHADPVTGENLDVELPHLPGDVRRDDVPILELHTEHRVPERFGDGACTGRKHGQAASSCDTE